MTEIQLKAHQNALTDEEDRDFIQECIFGKELATFLEDELKTRPHAVLDNYAEDYGRVLVVKSADGRMVQIACANSDTEDTLKDGTEHMVCVTPRRSWSAMLFTDEALIKLLHDVSSDVESILSSADDIVLKNKEFY
ncbi:MAG: hypothetical protein AAFZ99_03250 [Pseudomonadota bacterium]